MEIRFYNQDMDFMGVMENQTSLLWRRRYNEPGEFELYAPITENNLKLTERTNLIWMKGCDEAGVIEDRKLEESDTKNQITAKGRFISSYMDRRLIKDTINFNGRVEEAMRQLLSDAVPIPRVQLGELQGFEELVDFQATYKNLLDYEEKLAKSAGFGFRFRPDFNAKLIYFEIYHGADRTTAQGVNNRVVFSESYCNLNNTIYRENDQLLKTVAYVGGEGEGSDRAIVKVGDAEGLELREVFVDAKDIRKDELSTEQYEAVLVTRGQEKLAEDIVTSSFECDTGADVNYRYKVNYDLGDIVTVRKKVWGITQNQRITEVQEIYEYGGRRIQPTFGDSLPESIDWRDV